MMYADDDDDLDEFLDDLDDGTDGDVEVTVVNDHHLSASEVAFLAAITTPVAGSRTRVTEVLHDAGQRYQQPEPPLTAPSPPQQEEEKEPDFQPTSGRRADGVLLWDEFIGQEQAKRQLQIHIEAAASTGRALGHTLLSGPSGHGKTSLAQLIHLRYCEVSGLISDFIQLTAPVNRDQLGLVISKLSQKIPSFIFIDEIHKMADGGVRNAELLLHVLEDGSFTMHGQLMRLPPFTLIGGTTDPAKLPETIINRFSIQPTLRPYSQQEIVRIAHRMCNVHAVEADVDLLVCMARASLRNPRAARDLVMAARDLQQVGGQPPAPAELLQMLDLSPDGLTWLHRQYLKALLLASGHTAGEAHLASVLHEDVRTLRRLERPLLDLGLVERTPSGRLLTTAGVNRAQQA